MFPIISKLRLLHKLRQCIFFPIISKLRHLYLTHIDIPILLLVGASVSILSLVGASVSILSLVGASVSIHILLTSCWFEVQGKHSSSCSRPPPEPSISTSAWNLGKKEGRGGRGGGKKEKGEKGREEGKKRMERGRR